MAPEPINNEYHSDYEFHLKEGIRLKNVFKAAIKEALQELVINSHRDEYWFTKDESNK